MNVKMFLELKYDDLINLRNFYIKELEDYKEQIRFTEVALNEIEEELKNR